LEFQKLEPKIGTRIVSPIISFFFKNIDHIIVRTCRVFITIVDRKNPKNTKTYMVLQFWNWSCFFSIIFTFSKISLFSSFWLHFDFFFYSGCKISYLNCTYWKTSKQNFRTKFPNKISRQNLRTKFPDKIFGQNFQTKF